PFLNCPATSTDGDYLGAQALWSHLPAFGTDEDDNHQRVGALASMPVTNGVRYSVQQPAMQDLQQPPAMSTTMQTLGPSINSIPAFMGRNNAYSPSYSLQRGLGFPLGDVPRAHQYTTTRVLDTGFDRSQNTLVQPMMEQAQRSQPQTDNNSAPPFEETCVLESIVADMAGTQHTITPEVHAKMGRGFFPSEGKWTCYRRNYFAVTCSFTLQPWLSSIPLYLRKPDQTLEPIRGFAMSISAIVNGQYGETRDLVQHTPKRDKQSETRPGRVILQPAPPISLSAGTLANGSNSAFSQSMDCNSSFTNTAQPCQPPTQHIFQRIQFQKATANNGKRRAQQQTYNLIVELQAEVYNPIDGKARWVQVARRQSHAMVVRGRSPGHYKDGRRDSAASMGPDTNAGDGSGGSLPPGIGQAARSHLLMYDSGHRGQFGRTDYRHMPTAEHSPLSDSPLISSSSSSGFDYSIMNDTMDPMDTLKTDPYLKTDLYHDPTFAGVPGHQHRQQTNSGGYDPVCSTYGRYDPIQNPHRLCT
ncbi:p53-like transcription factor DNA-binding, partial [Penicillium riverlandense]|uniref:p53-like transcription factor DNA-binding n=1 Tax=Penicillium riverlandense TaxID=1903569 RepID=UPI002547351E